MPIHSALTGSDLHEPKGQSTASVNTVYVADGSGSGTHKKLTLDSLDLTSVQNPNTVFIHAVLPDVSTPSFIIVPAPANCTFVSAVSILSGAITGSDASVSFTRNDASSFGSAMVVAVSGSAEGVIDTFTATTNTNITDPGYVKISTNGASTDTQSLSLILKFTVTP